MCGVFSKHRIMAVSELRMLDKGPGREKSCRSELGPEAGSLPPPYQGQHTLTRNYFVLSFLVPLAPAADMAPWFKVVKDEMVRPANPPDPPLEVTLAGCDEVRGGQPAASQTATHSPTQLFTDPSTEPHTCCCFPASCCLAGIRQLQCKYWWREADHLPAGSSSHSAA